MSKSQTARVGNRAKGRRAVHLKGYYQARFAITAANKLKRVQKRLARRAKWVKRGVKKNGAKVCS